MGSDNRHDYYRILHVQPDAPTEVIKSSYRTLMQRLRMHPDLGGDHGDAALINEAYGVLSDPEKRARYDRQRPLPERQPAPSAPPGTAEPEPPAERSGSYRRRRATAGTGPHQCPFCHEEHGRRVGTDSLCAECASPLHRWTKPRSSADWLRALERIPRDLPIHFWSSWPQTQPGRGRLVDVSLTGLGFVTDEPLVKDQFLKLDNELLQAVARVVYSRPAGARWQIGVEFFTLRLASKRGTFVSDHV